MAEASAGSVDAFAQLYDRYGDRAYRVARSVCRDEERAQDAVHDAFLSVWRSRSSDGPQRGTLPARLLSAVRQCAIDRERHHRKPVSRRTDEAGPDALARLPDAHQEVITLAVFGELSHTEIATHLGIPAGTVKARMRRALEQLRGQYG